MTRSGLALTGGRASRVIVWCVLLGGFAAQAQLPMQAASQVTSQVTSQITPISPSSDTNPQRARILQERKTIETRFAQDEVACYQLFAVSDCLTQRRREKRDQVADLRRQEVLLNLADARARGAEQISRREGRISTEQLVKDADRLAQEQATQQQRLERMDERIAARQQAMTQEAENTRQQMARESQKRQEDAQREARRADEAANQRAYDERQLRVQQKPQARLKREEAPETIEKQGRRGR